MHIISFIIQATAASSGDLIINLERLPVRALAQTFPSEKKEQHNTQNSFVSRQVFLMPTVKLP